MVGLLSIMILKTSSTLLCVSFFNHLSTTFAQYTTFKDCTFSVLPLEEATAISIINSAFSLWSDKKNSQDTRVWFKFLQWQWYGHWIGDPYGSGQYQGLSHNNKMTFLQGRAFMWYLISNSGLYWHTRFDQMYLDNCLSNNSFQYLVPLFCYNSLYSSGKAFHQMLKHCCYNSLYSSGKAFH